MIHRLRANLPIIIFLALFFLLLGGFFSEAFSQTKYVVQVMSLATETSARTEAERLMAQGAPSFQRAEEVPGAGLRYRVYMGPFDTKAEATAAAEALKAQNLIKQYFVRAESETPTQSPPPSPAQTPPDNLGAVPVLPAAPETPASPGVPPAPPISPVAPPATPGPGTPLADQEYWPTNKPVPNQAPIEQGPRDWPPPGQDDQNWGQVQGGAPASGPSSPPQTSAPSSPSSGATSGDRATSQPGWSEPPASSVPPASPAIVAPVAPVAPAVPVAPGVSPNTPVLGSSDPPRPVSSGATIIPAKPTGPMKIQGFVVLSDLSSSMRSLSGCVGRLVKEEAATVFLRRMNQRIPSHPYVAALRVFGHKQAWTRRDYTTLYFGPGAYERGGFEAAIGRLYAADSISPFGWALEAAESELGAMNNPRAVIMVSDFEVTADPGEPTNKARAIRRKYGQDTRLFTFYVTNQKKGEKLATEIASAGGGQAYNICNILESETDFEAMMTEIFGPRDLPPCRDSDSDGVCDERDLCAKTPKGAPVDGRGCWIAAYSQFFDFDKAEVKYAFEPRLKAAAEILAQNPQLAEVTIAGHTDNKGSDKYNLDLGQKRAEAVKALLVKFGAPAEKLKIVSLGEERPIASNETEEGRAQNRRVEFHVGDIPQ